MFFIKNIGHWAVICLIIIQLAGQQAFADDLSITPYIPNVFSLQYGVDSDDGQNFFLYTNLNLKPRHRLSIGVGDQDETVSDSEEALDSSTYLVGYSFQGDQSWQFGAEYDFWGERDKITTNTVSAFISYSADWASVSVSPQFRKISLSTESQCDDKINSNSLLFDFTVYPAESWSLSASYQSYDYSKDPSKLLACVDPSEFDLIEARLQTVAYDDELSLGFEYYLDTETYGIQWTQAESAIDSSTTNDISTYVSMDALEDWSITLTLGMQENIDSSTTNYLLGTLTYYW